MIQQSDYFEFSLSRLDESGNKETHRYSLKLDLDFERHYVCFLKTLIKDGIFLQDAHLEDIASRYANAIKDKLESQVPWRQGNSEFASASMR